MRQWYRPPSDLTPEAAAVWREAERALDRLGTYDQAADHEALRRYVQAVDTARVMRTAAQAEPWVTGSTGQLKEHPGWRLAAEADRDAAKFAGDLLLTPASRKRAGITAGAAADEFNLASLALT